LFLKYKENGWETDSSTLLALTSSLLILVPFLIFRKNFMKNTKKKTSHNRCFIFR